jgi:ketosteroid isomerase-like protein
MKKLIFLLALCLSFSCNDSNVTTEKVDTDQVAADLISMSKDYQQAYISQDWDTASKWISSELGTTIYNSNGSALTAQNEQQVSNTERGWDFGTFEMSNHKVSMSSDMNTAVITFDADGLINFADGEQNVAYATRASQTWVNENGEWKVMHSHWSPRTNSQGIPQQD